MMVDSYIFFINLGLFKWGSNIVKVIILLKGKKKMFWKVIFKGSFYLFLRKGCNLWKLIFFEIKIKKFFVIFKNSKIIINIFVVFFNILIFK